MEPNKCICTIFDFNVFYQEANAKSFMVIHSPSALNVRKTRAFLLLGIDLQR